MSKYKGIFFSLFFLIVGIITGTFFSQFFIDKTNWYVEKHSGQKRFTNKLLDFDIPPSKELGDYKEKLEEKTNDLVSQNQAEIIGVYYRDLNNGPWVGVNHSEKFIPASLLKIPLMMIYYKQAEKDPSILSKKYKYTEPKMADITSRNYAPTNNLKVGTEYTVNELINRMIRYSDNEALYILSTNSNQDELKKLYSEIGFQLPVTSAQQDFASSRNIGSFFRVLYNATYLNQEMSEKALMTLSEANFDKGLVAGVPSDIVVAQKFGEREFETVKELHDCGIIYFPKHPYILCIMTKGKDFNELTGVIKEISKLTYEYVKKSNP